MAKKKNVYWEEFKATLQKIYSASFSRKVVDPSKGSHIFNSRQAVLELLRVLLLLLLLLHLLQ